MRQRNQNTKGQNALEFSFMLGMVMIGFLLLFLFLNGSFTSIVQVKTAQTGQEIADRVYEKIIFMHNAQDGMRVSFDPLADFDSQEYKVSIRSGTDIIVNDSQNMTFVRFLPKQFSLSGQICPGTNTLMKSSDYGVKVCCDECAPFDTQGLYECKNETVSYWSNCNYFFSNGLHITQIRFTCPYPTRNASLTLTDNAATNVYDGVQAYPHRLNYTTKLVWMNYTFSPTYTVTNAPITPAKNCG